MLYEFTDKQIDIINAAVVEYNDTRDDDSDYKDRDTCKEIVESICHQIEAGGKHEQDTTSAMAELQSKKEAIYGILNTIDKLIEKAL